MIEELKKYYNDLKILKTYPDSGQKWVYLVELEEYGIVILKIIKNMNERIQREIDIVNQNDIPGVPKVLLFSKFVHNGVEYYYIFEEYIRGESLTKVLKKGPLEMDKCLVLLEDLLKTVSTLEQIDVVHRDIKPDNIICGEDKHFHLIDFGIARNLNLSSLTLTEVAVGPHTPGYGAPELFQYNKSKINSKADLFSVGIVVYQSIFGKHPFLSGLEFDRNEIWYKTATVVPKTYKISGDTDGQLFGLIMTMMQKQVSKRPPSAAKALEWFYVVLSTIKLP